MVVGGRRFVIFELSGKIDEFLPQIMVAPCRSSSQVIIFSWKSGHFRVFVDEPDPE